MSSLTQRTVPASAYEVAKKFGLVAICAAALVTILGMAQAPFTRAAVAPNAPGDRSRQCRQDSGVALDRLAATGLDLRTPKMLHDRERAIQACQDGFPDLHWLGR